MIPYQAGVTWLDDYLQNAVSTMLCGPPMVTTDDLNFRHYCTGHYSIQSNISVIKIIE